MLIAGAITVTTIPTAIFILPLFAVFLPINVSMYQHIIGMFALLFGMIFVALCLFMSPDSVVKEGKEDE